MGNHENITNNQIQQQDETEKASDNAPSFEQHMQEITEQPHRKTVEEKAREMGYHKNEDGVWMRHDDYGFNEQTGCWEPGYGDGSDEPVEWFKLDEEYPDLADKTEALAEKYHVEYNDYGGLKEAVYKNADRLSESSDERLENIFAVANGISFATVGTDELLVRYDDDELSKIHESLDKFYSTTASKMPEGELDRGIMGISECFVRNFNANLIEGDFLDKLSEYSAKAFQNSENKHLLIRGIEYGIKGISTNGDSGKLFGEYMKYANELVGDRGKITDYETKFACFTGYVRDHGVSEETISGFRDVIFPLIEQNNAEVIAVIRGGNAYGTIKGTYGIADYTEECLLSKYTPKDIDRLIRIYHEIPTSDYRKFEQNRKDAAKLQGTIIGGRDFIHDERIGANEVLSAIKDFYEHREGKEAENYKRKLEALEEKYRFGVLPNAFNLEAYEKPVEFMSNRNKANEGNPNERAIDILNRLVENTRLNLFRVPTTEFPELNELMNKIAPLVNERTGEVGVEIKEVGAAVAKINEILIRKHNEQGIMPSTISAIAFLDKMSAHALRGVSHKAIQELAFDPNFKEMVRFSQLTSSMEYDNRNFEEKYQQVIHKVGEAYGEGGIDKSIISEGYRILSRNILGNVQALGKNYASKSTTARFTEAVWSGNLSDELIGLFQRV